MLLLLAVLQVLPLVVQSQSLVALDGTPSAYESTSHSATLLGDHGPGPADLQIRMTSYCGRFAWWNMPDYPLPPSFQYDPEFTHVVTATNPNTGERKFGRIQCHLRNSPEARLVRWLTQDLYDGESEFDCYGLLSLRDYSACSLNGPGLRMYWRSYTVSLRREYDLIIGDDVSQSTPIGGPGVFEPQHPLRPDPPTLKVTQTGPRKIQVEHFVAVPGPTEVIDANYILWVTLADADKTVVANKQANILEFNGDRFRQRHRDARQGNSVWTHDFNGLPVGVPLLVTSQQYKHGHLPETYTPFTLESWLPPLPDHFDHRIEDGKLRFDFEFSPSNENQRFDTIWFEHANGERQYFANLPGRVGRSWVKHELSHFGLSLGDRAGVRMALSNEHGTSYTDYLTLNVGGVPPPVTNVQQYLVELDNGFNFNVTLTWDPFSDQDSGVNNASLVMFQVRVGDWPVQEALTNKFTFTSKPSKTDVDVLIWAMNPAGREGEVTVTKVRLWPEVVVPPAAPVFIAIDNPQPHQLHLSWEAVPKAQKYVVQFGSVQSPSFTTRSTHDTSILLLSLPAGLLRVSVAAQRFDKRGPATEQLVYSVVEFQKPTVANATQTAADALEIFVLFADRVWSQNVEIELREILANGTAVLRPRLCEGECADLGAEHLVVWQQSLASNGTFQVRAGVSTPLGRPGEEFWSEWTDVVLLAEPQPEPEPEPQPEPEPEPQPEPEPEQPTTGRAGEETQQEAESNTSTGAVVAAVLVPVLVLLAVAGGVYYMHRRKSKKVQVKGDEELPENGLELESASVAPPPPASP